MFGADGEVVRSWGPAVHLTGPAPVGEIESRCPGCNTRFIAGELAMHRTLGVFPIGFMAHVQCTDRVEELERAT